MGQYLTLFNIILCLILCFAILKYKGHGTNWLALSLALWAIHTFMRFRIFTENSFIIIYAPIIVFPASLFIGSAVLFLSNSLLFNLKNRNAIRHFIFPGIILIIHILMIIILKEEMNIFNIFSQVKTHRAYAIFISLSIAGYNIALITLALLRTIKYKSMCRENQSDGKSKNANWFFNFACLNMSLFIFKSVVVVFSLAKKNLPFLLIDDFILLLILCFSIYYLLTKSKILPLEGNDKLSKNTKYAKVNLPAGIRKKYARQLNEYMIQKKAFLESDLSNTTFSKF